MPITRAVGRYSCASANAFNVSTALKTALGLPNKNPSPLLPKPSRSYTSNGRHLQSSPRAAIRPVGLDIQHESSEQRVNTKSEEQVSRPHAVQQEQQRESLADFEIGGAATVAEWHRNTDTPWKVPSNLERRNAELNGLHHEDKVDRPESPHDPQTRAEHTGGVKIRHVSTHGDPKKERPDVFVSKGPKDHDVDEYEKGPLLVLRASKQVNRYGARFREPNTYRWQDAMRKVAEDAQRVSQRRASDPMATKVLKRFAYSPWVIDLPPSPFPPDELKPLPWAVPASGRRNMSPLAVLSMEIENFQGHIASSAAEEAARQAIIEEVLEIIRANVNNDKYKAEIQGSQQTKLVMPQSDIDIRLCWVHKEDEWSPHSMTKTIKHIGYHLRRSPSFTDVEVREAAYPIVTAIHEATGIEVQIVSAPSTQRQQEATARYLEELPHLRQVYCVVKTALQMRGLIDVHTGGTGAYGLFMMLVAALKQPSPIPPLTPADYLTTFLDFYSTLDTTTHGVTLTPPSLFPKHDPLSPALKPAIDTAYAASDPLLAGQHSMSQRRRFQPYLLCLQDPATPTNDLGRKTNAYKHIRKTILSLKRTLERDFKSMRVAEVKGEDWTQESLLEPLVGRCHEVLLGGRRRVERFGLGILLEREKAKDKEPGSGAAIDG